MSLKPSDVVNLSDDELRERMTSSTPLPDSSQPFGGFSTYLVDDKIVAKFSSQVWGQDPDLNREVMAMRFVWDHTTIPIPRPYRALRSHDLTVIVMDFIDGERLDRAWPTLSLWSRFRVVWTLRSYVRQLRRIPVPPPPFPGPLGPNPTECHGTAFHFLPVYLQERAWTTTEELLGALKKTADNRFCDHHNGQEPTPRPEFENTGPLVFTHHDLNMRNVILGKDGKIWLLDWDYSGYYPRYFEYLSMYVPAQDARARSEPSLWSYHPFVTDPFFPVHAWLCGSPRPILNP